MPSILRSSDNFAAVASAVWAFVNATGYKPKPWTPNQKLREIAWAKAINCGVDFDHDPHSYPSLTFQVACTVIDLSYPEHELELQVHLTMYTWLSFMIDDTSSKMDEHVELFQQRFIEGTPQPTALLQRYAETLRILYKYYHSVVANWIIQSSLSFVTCCFLETRKEYRNMQQQEAGRNWAYFFRDKEGLADAYCLFSFPQKDCPDISAFLQAVPDITIYINLGNDILSFYKEELQGETNNYIHTRARYTHKEPIVVLQEVVEETVAAQKRVSALLDGQGSIEHVWNTFWPGYITFHRKVSRYCLDQIGIGE
ncbi:isoprenoid synthase domain-containing protein [Mycena galopus ATCC 62051]|nr:isoprenoid synthase domain-containing protein [Mycena galopus ATCC 62051]